MHKKLGPLETWQWAAILAALLGGYLLYEHEKSTASTAASATPLTTSEDAPIDPGSYGGWSGSGGTGSTDTGSSTGTDIASELGDVSGMISTLEQAGLVQPVGTGTILTGPGSPAGLTAAQAHSLKALNTSLGKDTKAITRDTRTITSLKKTVSDLQKQVRKASTTSKHGGTKHPGHKVTTHRAGGKTARTASSSAPHNARQHTNVAPPHHQKAPTKTRKKVRHH